jgi:hypothetical protein
MHCCGRIIRFKIWKPGSKIPSWWRSANDSWSGDGNTTAPQAANRASPQNTEDTSFTRRNPLIPAVIFTAAKRWPHAEITGPPPMGHRRLGYRGRSRVLHDAAMLT